MKSFINILCSCVVLLFCNNTLAQTETSKETKESLWHSSTAKTLKKGRTESGIFAPLRIGLKNKTELSVHPILFFVIPNVKIKKNWTLDDNKKWQIASEHSLTMPTILLQLLARNGVGGILPSTAKIPPILMLKNRIIASYYYHKTHSVSVKAGMEVNLLQSMYKPFPSIDLLFVYPRTVAYHHFYSGEVALNFAGVFAQKFGYDADMRMFLLPAKNNLAWAFEWNPKLYYNISNQWRIMAGAIVSTGNIPHEKAKVRALPVLDVQFSFRKKKKLK